jgi:hypothetical protein
LTEDSFGEPPDNVVTNQSYGETLRSNRIDIVTLEPNQVFTSTIFGVLVEESLTVSGLITTPMSFTNEPLETLGLNKINVSSATLVETIVYKNSAQEEQNKLQLNNILVVDGTLQETIVYKTQSQSETDKVSLGNITVQGISLETTINYINKDAQNLDTMSVNSLIVSSGTLQ